MNTWSILNHFDTTKNEWREALIVWQKYLETNTAMTSAQREEFISRLSCRQQQQKDDALAEIQTAYFIECVSGLRIIEWKTKGLGNYELEFSFICNNTKIVCEVKRPSWKADIVDRYGEHSLRLKRPKYLTDDPEISFRRSPMLIIREQIEEMLEKLRNDQPSLLVIKDNLWGYDTYDCLSDMRLNKIEPIWPSEYKNIGGILALSVRSQDELSFVIYKSVFMRNLNALFKCQLPKDLYFFEYRTPTAREELG